MHDWSEKNIPWKDINDAAAFIGKGLRRWRVPVRDYKEKYGTVRVYNGFGWYQLSDITHPGYAYVQYKRDGLLWKLNWNPLVMGLIGIINPLVIRLHVALYKYYYREAIKRWPHLREEILVGADWDEHLTEHGIHKIRTGENTYETRMDWHPDNWSARFPGPIVADQLREEHSEQQDSTGGLSS